MLSLAFVIGEDTGALKHALPGLIGLASETRPLLFVDHGAASGGREMIQAFIRRHGGMFAALEGPLPAADLTAFARQQTGADYVLVLTPQDRIHRAGLAALEQTLAKTAPARVILASGSWASSADHPVPGPDAARAGGDPRALFADPRRLLLRGGAIADPDPLTDPAAAWALWDRELSNADDDLACPPLPVLLRPLPETGAAASFDAATGWLAQNPGPPDRLLLRLDDALALAPARAAPETLAAAARLWAALPRARRRQLHGSTGPAADLLRAVAHKDQARATAQLALLAQARADLRAQALAADYAALRHDLDLALPGPDYLRDLYTRLRGV